MIFIRLDASDPLKKLKIKGLEHYEYFHLAKWLQIPIIKEHYSPQISADNKYYCSGRSINIQISRDDFDLKDRGHLIFRKILKRRPPNSYGSPMNMAANEMTVQNNSKRFGILKEKRLNFLNNKKVTLYSKM